MDKKARTNYLVLIIVIVLIMLATGIMVIRDGKVIFPWAQNQHQYLISVGSTSNITKFETLKVDILIKNPQNYPIIPELEVKYDSSWRTTNQYLINRQKIPLDSISPNNIQRYSIEFNPPYVSNQYFNFTFNIYVNDNLMDSREAVAYVR